MDKKENLVKEVCKELNITQKELADMMGVNDSTVRTWSSKGNLSNTTIKFLESLLENHRLKEKINKFKQAFELIDEARK